MVRRFEGKTVVLTGGSKGLGRATTQRFVEEGAEVLITARHEEELEQAARAIDPKRVKVKAGDISRPDFCHQLIDHATGLWGRIDVLVNNAGVFDEAAFLDIKLENWRFVLDVMLQAPFLLSQRTAAVMVANGGGSIVSLSSIDGHAADGPYTSYSVAKAGLMQLTRNIAAELGPHGVRANTVSPGWALTPMVEAAASQAELERMRSAFDRVPLKRMVSPEEVAAAVCFLASDDASGITGADLVVDCGTMADLYILPTLERGSGQ